MVEGRWGAERDPEGELGLIVVDNRTHEVDPGLGEQSQAVEHLDRPAQVLAASFEVLLEAELGGCQLLAGDLDWFCAAAAAASEALTSPRAMLIVRDCSALISPIRRAAPGSRKDCRRPC